MVFRWDPNNTGPGAQASLWGQITTGAQYTLTSEMRPVANIMPHVSANGKIDHERAWKLNPTNPSNGNVRMETFLLSIRLLQLNNPPPF
jgi:antitoxin (DNA-binding transcriptional repressor) of toxin-antitoxin stability system